MPSKPIILPPWPAFFILLVLVFQAGAQVAGNPLFTGRAEKELLRAQKFFQADTNDFAAARQLARASFELADLTTNHPRQAEIARMGIEVCRQWLGRVSNSAPGHYYLALNLGELASAEAPSLAAYRLVYEVEREFQTAAALDVQWDFAGPARCLGLLYRDAPGWPISIGSKRKSREWLDRAAALAPEFPENLLNLAETHLQWRQMEETGKALARLAVLWPVAQTNLTGESREKDWCDWNFRRQAVQSEFNRFFKPRNSR